jgi:hypothetical protein
MSIVVEGKEDVSQTESVFKKSNKVVDMDDMIFGKISGIVKKKSLLKNKQKAASRLNSMNLEAV